MVFRVAGLRDPCTRDVSRKLAYLDSGIQGAESGIKRVESGIQGVHGLPYMRRHVDFPATGQCSYEAESNELFLCSYMTIFIPRNYR